MKYLIHLCWKVLLPFDEGFDPSSANSKFFNLSGGRSFARALGGDFQLERTPVVLSPTDLFHDALRQTRIELGLKGRRFPYRFECSNLQEVGTANFVLHCHASFLCVTVRLDPFQVQDVGDWAKLQDLRAHHILWPLTRKVLTLTLKGDKTAPLNREPQVLPAIHIQALEGDLPDWKSRLVSLVTGHANVNTEIVNSALEKNQTHQLDETLLLVDKQGIAAYVPSGTVGSAARANLDRFENSTVMLQLAAVLRLKLRAGSAVADDERLAILNPNAAIISSVSGRRIWSLFVLEFSLSIWLKRMDAPALNALQLPRQAASISSTPETSRAELVRILLVTVTAVETRALRLALADAICRQPVVRKVDGFSYQDFGKLGDYEVLHQISGMGSGGIDGSQESVRRSIQAVRPDAILMVGIAFGVNPTKQPIGTILVSKQILTYELQRVNKDASIAPRGDTVTASPMLLNWVSHAEVDWPETLPEIKKGLVLSGEKLVDNQDFRDQLIKIAPEAIGGEMEGAGVYVASQNAKVEWLLVKAVCDWADGNKATNKDELQAKAAKAAAEFTVHILRANSEKFP